MANATGLTYALDFNGTSTKIDIGQSLEGPMHDAIEITYTDPVLRRIYNEVRKA